jgi:hypothetical protein
MFGGVLDAEQLGDLCDRGLQRPILGSMLPVIRSNSPLDRASGPAVPVVE